MRGNDSIGFQTWAPAWSAEICFAPRRFAVSAVNDSGDYAPYGDAQTLRTISKSEDAACIRIGDGIIVAALSDAAGLGQPFSPALARHLVMTLSRLLSDDRSFVEALPDERLKEYEAYLLKRMTDELTGELGAYSASLAAWLRDRRIPVTHFQATFCAVMLFRFRGSTKALMVRCGDSEIYCGRVGAMVQRFQPGPDEGLSVDESIVSWRVHVDGLEHPLQEFTIPPQILLRLVDGEDLTWVALLSDGAKVSPTELVAPGKETLSRLRNIARPDTDDATLIILERNT